MSSAVAVVHSSWPPLWPFLTVLCLIGLSIERPYFMIKLNLKSLFQSNVRSSLWFPFKSVSIMGIGDWRLSRQTCEMRVLRKTLWYGNSLVSSVHIDCMPNSSSFMFYFSFNSYRKLILSSGESLTPYKESVLWQLSLFWILTVNPSNYTTKDLTYVRLIAIN